MLQWWLPKFNMFPGFSDARVARGGIYSIASMASSYTSVLGSSSLTLTIRWRWLWWNLCSSNWTISRIKEDQGPLLLTHQFRSGFTLHWPLWHAVTVSCKRTLGGSSTPSCKRSLPFPQLKDTSKVLYLWCGPLPLTVTTRIITFLAGDPYKLLPLLPGGGHTQNISSRKPLVSYKSTNRSSKGQGPEAATPSCWKERIDTRRTSNWPPPRCFSKFGGFFFNVTTPTTWRYWW